MKIDCISDLHGFLPALDGGDLLIIAGDLTGSDRMSQFEVFSKWLKKQKYKKKIVIAGNHDGILEYFPRNQQPFVDGKKEPFAVYLHDEGVEYEGLTIWGSPYTPTYYKWSFMRNRGEQIKKHWDKIPNNIDILITHGPPFGILDRAYNTNWEKVGCEDLFNAVKRVQPKLHVFGHVHEGYGKHEETWLESRGKSTLFVNCAIMDRNYDPINQPITVEL